MTISTILLILLAALGAAASVREIFYVKALSKNIEKDAIKIVIHFALAVLAVLVLFAPEDRLPFPHFAVYIISIILSYYSIHWPLDTVRVLLIVRYEEYQEWICELLLYESKSLYRLPDLPPEPELPEDMNLPLHNDLLQPTFDEWFNGRYVVKDKVTDRALRRRKEQLEDRERKNKKK